MTTSFENLTINLQHDIDEQYQYQPGETINGKVGIHLHRTTQIQKIYITISGEGVAAWDDEYDGPLHTNEIYINASKVIFEVKESNNQRPMSLDNGNHEFPFEYQLPDNIPSSFIGKYGSVTYILKAVIQGVRTGDTNIATEPFLVLRNLPLPEEATKPVERYEARKYWATCSYGKLKVKMRLNKTGFIAGEDMFLYAEVQNKSPLRVTAIQAAVIMNTKYHAQKRTTEFRQIVNKRRDEYELTEGDGRRWQNVRIAVPPYIPESFLDYCDIIQITYSFQFRVEISSGNEIKMELPLIVGAYPKSNVPMEKSKSGNSHWTVGPRDFSSHMTAYEDNDQQDDWHSGLAEFRQPETLVKNPLYKHESIKHNGKAGREPDFTRM